jgi:pimeloyl-ACP methyl ester carboxylesterase
MMPAPLSFQEMPYPDSRVLLIAFSGLQPRRKVPSFHWRNSLMNAPANKLFVRDVRQMFYQCGVPGTGDDAASVGRFLRQYIEEWGIERHICIGGSAGGYAALLYGGLTGAGEVYAFSPMTYLPTRPKRQLIGLVRTRQWGLLKANTRLHFDPRLDRTYFDLRPVLGQGHDKTRYHIYYGTNHPRDVANAAHVADLSRVVLHPQATDAHDTSRLVRDSGELAEILGRVMGFAADPAWVPAGRADIGI